MGRELTYIFSSLIKWAIFFGILYLIFTNFGTFLIILFIFVAIGYYFFYQFKKKLKESSNQSFKFTFNGKDFSSGSGFNAKDFNFEQFEEQFRRGNFNTPPQFGEVEKAKEFFGFTSTPTKEEIKKRYKELAKKYHPDINHQDDTMMQQLNHYKEVLLKVYGN
ncbi:J domain-containing protein [Halarcobacter anaerophilus]|uniref:Molecular chaperone DnaJ n=1 Tax=Halarcobacter anaerophilus TaxID=877500 RepID=A0A4Q0Y1C1_9BACT|nr:J domain-containing protein [Halarcobacter anaerophilus]QDF28515.1 DnaJ domain-containing protein [Halarcobacter anaerophilus]RXJ63245.1 molecular chaperone DnaJ [Halarcobacter anaerophilus]